MKEAGGCFEGKFADSALRNTQLMSGTAGTTSAQFAPSKESRGGVCIVMRQFLLLWSGALMDLCLPFHAATPVLVMGHCHFALSSPSRCLYTWTISHHDPQASHSFQVNHRHRKERSLDSSKKCSNTEHNSLTHCTDKPFYLKLATCPPPCLVYPDQGSQHGLTGNENRGHMS